MMADPPEDQKDQINSNFGQINGIALTKSFWFFDLIQAKVEQLKPMLNTVLTSDLKDRLFLDQLKTEDVLVVIQTIFDHPTYLWTSEELIQAWGKSRSGKDNQNSDYFREEGNEHVKSGNNINGSNVKQMLLCQKGIINICCWYYLKLKLHFLKKIYLVFHFHLLKNQIRIN